MKSPFQIGLWVIAFAFGVLLWPSASHAGGAFFTTTNGTPVLWANGEVFYRMDPGGPEDSDTGGSGGAGGGSCSLIKDAEAQTIKGVDGHALVRQAFATWAGVTSGLDITEGPMLPENVTFANAEEYYVGNFTVEPFTSNVTADPCYSGDQDNCLNSVIFDPHGLITDAALGQCARYGVFGFASPLPQFASDGSIASPLIKAAQFVISGACVTPVDVGDPNCFGSGWPAECPVELDASGTGLLGVITHEVGHFLGLDHVLVEKDTYLKCSAPGADCTAEELEKIPTMIGLAVEGANLATLTQDDISAIRGFYPDTGTSTCTMSGTVQDVFGDNGRCVEVVAEKVGDPSYRVATVSGAYVPRKSFGESCRVSEGSSEFTAATYGQCLASDPQGDELKVHTNCAKGNPADCGEFELRGLEPGNYKLSLQTFSVNTNGGGDTIDFILEPCDQPRNQGSLSDKADAGTFNLTCPAGNNVGIIKLN